MKVSYFPVGIKSSGQKISLNSFVEQTSAKLRNDLDKNKIEFVKERFNHQCNDCNSTKKLEVHHIKPVWVHSLEIIIFVIDSISGNENIYDVMQKNLSRFDISFSPCNSINNLELLCQKCHDKKHKKSMKVWMNWFESKYRVVFGIRNYKREKFLLNN